MTRASKTIVVATLTAFIVAGTAGAAVGGDDERVERFCRKMVGIDLSIGTTPGLTSSDLVGSVTKTKQKLKKLVKAAPEKDLKQALKLLVKYYAAIAAAGDVNAVVYGPEQKAAVETLAAYAGTVCIPLLS